MLATAATPFSTGYEKVEVRMPTKQQPLNERQFKCLSRLMTLIAECEGGYLDISDTGARITTAIPEELWCTDCVALMERVVELRERWSNRDPKK